MILAAAIKFHIEKTNKDVVLCGVRHGDIYKQLKAIGFKPRCDYTEIEQGFVDHNNTFLTREEAYTHAKYCGQLASKIIADREDLQGFNLISEDLW